MSVGTHFVSKKDRWTRHIYPSTVQDSSTGQYLVSITELSCMVHDVVCHVEYKYLHIGTIQNDQCGVTALGQWRKEKLVCRVNHHHHRMYYGNFQR